MYTPLLDVKQTNKQTNKQYENLYSLSLSTRYVEHLSILNISLSRTPLYLEQPFISNNPLFRTTLYIKNYTLHLKQLSISCQL